MSRHSFVRYVFCALHVGLVAMRVSVLHFTLCLRNFHSYDRLIILGFLLQRCVLSPWMSLSREVNFLEP